MVSVAAGRRRDAADHPHGGGFAGPVGPEEPERLAPAQLEVDPVHGGELAEPLGQARGANEYVRIGHDPTVPGVPTVSNEFSRRGSGAHGDDAEPPLVTGKPDNSISVAGLRTSRHGRYSHSKQFQQAGAVAAALRRHRLSSHHQRRRAARRAPASRHPAESEVGRQVGAISGLYARFRHLIHESPKFGVVGGIGFVVSLVGADLLRYDAGLGTYKAIIIATLVATVVTFVGNRYWTYRHRRAPPHRGRESVTVLRDERRRASSSTPIGIIQYGSA